ncbi:MAG: AAA family ATPase, partial [Bacteroidota bacterium]
MSQLRYTGEKLRFPKNIKRGKGKKATVETLHPYHPDPELVKAVNLAILIRRPLLLMGEPGCGKSILAKALAYELHHEEATKQSDEVIIKKDYDDYYYEWKIKSSSKAVDGLYEFDAIERLGKAQLLSQQKDLTEADFKGKLAAKEFVTRKDMGLAIEKSTTESNRAVLLID